MHKIKGVVLVLVVVVGFFFVTGTLGRLSSTPSGVFGIVAVLAVLLLAIGWYSNRRRW